MIETNRQGISLNLRHVTQALAKNMPLFVTGQLSVAGKQNESPGKTGYCGRILNHYFSVEPRQSPLLKQPADHKFSKPDESTGDDLLPPHNMPSDLHPALHHRTQRLPARFATITIRHSTRQHASTPASLPDRHSAPGPQNRHALHLPAPQPMAVPPHHGRRLCHRRLQ